MYIEERINELNSRVERLEQRLQDLVLGKEKDKPVLRFYRVDVPVAWEDFTQKEVRVSISGKTLVNYHEEFNPELLDGHDPGDWLNAILLCIGYLDLLDFDHLTLLTRELEETKDAQKLRLIKNCIEQSYTLVYDSYLEVDVGEFCVYY